MKRGCFRILACFALLAAVSGPAGASDLTGTWRFSVDLENGEHGDPVFVLKQVNDQLTGVYQGPFGKQKVTGNIKGDRVTFEVTASGSGRTLKLSYTARVEGPDKMSGEMTRNISGDSTPGKWTATRSR